MKTIRELSVVPTKRGPRKLKFGALVVTITQADLVELELLRQDAKAANALWRNKRRYIRDALESGAAVEPGARLGTLETRKVLVVR